MNRGDLRVRARLGKPIVAVVLTLVSAAACTPAGDEGEGGDPPAGSEGTAEPAPTAQATSPEVWFRGFAVGERVDTRGAIPPEARTEEFRAGEPIYVSMEVGDAPPAVSVHAVFYDAAGNRMAEDAKKVPARAGHVYLESGRTSDWAPGEGTIAMAVDGRQVAEASFTLLESDPAAGTGARAARPR